MMVPSERLLRRQQPPMGWPASAQLLCGCVHEPADVNSYGCYASHAIIQHVLHAHITIQSRVKSFLLCCMPSC